MLFLPIHELEIFDQVDSSKSMIFSVRVDGEPIYGCAVRSLEPVPSCIATVGAFESENRQSLVAWIDPASGRFISLKSITGFSRPGAVAISVGLGLIAFRLLRPILFGVNWHRQDGASLWIPAAAALAGAAAACAAMFHFPLPSKLEVELRRQFECRRTAPGVNQTTR